MSGASAGGRMRLLRLGLATGAASLGAVALSLLIGGSAASATEDDQGDLLGGVVALVTEPVDAVVAELDSALAPVEAVVEPIADPIVAPAAPLVQAVVAAPAPIVADVAHALEPALAPLAPVTQPIADLVDTALAPVAAVLDPLVHSVDGAVEALPVVDDLLGEQPVAAVVEPVVDAVADAVPTPVAEVAGAAPLPGGAPPTASDAGVMTDVVEASAPVVRGERALVAGPEAQRGVPAVTGASPPDPAEHPAHAPATPAALPSGSSGAAGGASPPSAITPDHLVLAPASGEVKAVERDRLPTAPVEELTASPD